LKGGLKWKKGANDRKTPEETDGGGPDGVTTNKKNFPLARRGREERRRRGARGKQKLNTLNKKGTANSRENITT